MNIQEILKEVDEIENYQDQEIGKSFLVDITRNNTPHLPTLGIACNIIPQDHKNFLLDSIRTIIERLEEAEEVMKYYAEGCHLYTENTDEETTEYIGDYQYGGSVENGFKAKAYLEKYK